PDVHKEREFEAVKRRLAEIIDMQASPGLSRAKRRRLEAERELLESFAARLAGTTKDAPPWDSAGVLLFAKGLRDANNAAGDRTKEYFRFLIRFAATFPENKKFLSRADVQRAYLDNTGDLLKIAAIQRPLAAPETLRF